MHSNTQSRIHPHKFALWISMASIVMMFIAFTSAYIVRQAVGNWLEFPLPSVFLLSTGVLLLSSFTLHFSLRAFKKADRQKHRLYLVASFVLGIAFVVLQYKGWMTLFGMGIELTGNPSGSFLYLISGVHALHIIGGLAAMLVALLHAFSLPCRPTSRRVVRFELVNHYWHFVDALWIYLLIFLIIQ